MKYFLIIIALFFSSFAEAQSSRNPCYNTGQGIGINGSTNCVSVGTSTPLPVTGSFTPSGTQNVQGTGTAGTPAGGVLSIQGVTGGTPQNVSGNVGIDQTTPGTTNAVSANQGTANTLANAWPIKNTDGTNTAAVKAASTAPATTDPALVVSISPNTPAGALPTGAATSANQTNGTQQVEINNGANIAAVKAASTPSPATDPSLSVTLNAGSNGLIGTGTFGSPATQVVSVQGPATGGNYPPNATAIGGNGSGSTAAVVGTLAAAASKSTYLCEFDISAIGGTAAVGPIVVAGLTGGSRTYQLTASASGVFLTKSFSPCLPSSALNTAITITTTADGTATAVNVNSSGYQQ